MRSPLLWSVPVVIFITSVFAPSASAASVNQQIQQLKSNSAQAEQKKQQLAGQKTLQSLVVPSDFTALQGSAVATFGQAATGFDRLARGLNRAADPQIDGAVKDIEIATNKNQVIDKDLLVSLAVNSSVLRQLAELPEKVEHAQER